MAQRLMFNYGLRIPSCSPVINLNIPKPKIDAGDWAHRQNFSLDETSMILELVDLLMRLKLYE